MFQIRPARATEHVHQTFKMLAFRKDSSHGRDRVVIGRATDWSPMSTSSLTRDTRDFPLGSRARREIERRVREAQEKLTRKTRGGERASTLDHAPDEAKRESAAR